MKNAKNGLISDIYRILATYDLSVFFEALEDKRTPRSIRRVLAALCDEAERSNVERRHISSARVPLRELHDIKSSRPLIELEGSERKEAARILLSDKSRFPTKSSLLSLLSDLGANVNFSSKASRDAVASKSASVISSNTRLWKKFIGTIERTIDSQTRGWIEVIGGK